MVHPYYEDTRNPDIFIQSEKNISIPFGTYRLSLNIQDQDSKKNWHLEKEINLDNVQTCSPILPFVKNKFDRLEFSSNIIEQIDTLWIRSQIYIQENQINQIKYKINNKGNLLDSGFVSIKEKSLNHLYLIPIPFEKAKNGINQIILSYLESSQSTSVRYGIVNDIFWTDDLDEIIGVMNYLINSNSEYKKLKNMDDQSKWSFLNRYWKKKDPSPNTSTNELLLQFNKRVKFVNKNFSILKSGWKSDRGKIYIIYGKPQNIESYNDEMGYNYQKWKYFNWKQFIFIDRMSSGEYSLYREIY